MPAERAHVFQGTQIGVESTKGTVVAASKRLLDTQFAMSPMTPVKPFRPQGSKAPTTATREKEWTEGTLDGPLSYNDIIYLMSGVLCSSSGPSTPTGATNLRRWTWLPSNFSPDNYVTYTIETGSTAYAERAAFGLINEVKIRWSKTDAAVTGSVLAQGMVDEITLTSNPTNIAENPADPEDITAFMGTALTNCVQTIALGGASGGNYKLVLTDPFKGTVFTTANIAFGANAAAIKSAIVAAGSWVQSDDITVAAASDFTLTFNGRLTSIDIATVTVVDTTTGGTGVVVTKTTPGGLTKLNRNLEMEWSIGGRFAGVFTLNEATPSFDAEVEKAPTLGGELILQANTEGVNFMAQLRAKTTVYVKMVAIGGVAETGFTYRFSMTTPFKFIEAPRAAKDEQWAITYKLSPIYDATLGGYVKVEVDNLLTAL